VQPQHHKAPRTERSELVARQAPAAAFLVISITSVRLLIILGDLNNILIRLDVDVVEVTTVPEISDWIEHRSRTS
jgi:hypothetical protein